MKISLRSTHAQLLDLLPRAGQIVRQYFLSEELPKTQKGVHDFATAADLASNTFLQKELKKILDVPMLTEETGSHDFAYFKKQDYCWIIDPLDGTSNFARGDSNFSISVALVSEGNPVIGLIYLPITSRLFWAIEEESDAHCNGPKIHVSPIEHLGAAVVCTDWSHILETRDETTMFLRKIYGKVRQIKILGSAATDVTLLARGGVDIYHHVRLFPWDVAASGLIAARAGAKVTQVDGQPWNAFSESMLTANPILHKKILTLIS